MMLYGRACYAWAFTCKLKNLRDLRLEIPGVGYKAVPVGRISKSYRRVLQQFHAHPREVLMNQQETKAYMVHRLYKKTEIRDELIRGKASQLLYTYLGGPARLSVDGA